MQNKKSELYFRKAIMDDSALVLEMLRESASEQGLQDDFFTKESDLLRDVFGEVPRANILIIERDAEIVGLVVFFFNFASFIGCAGIYIEDIYVRREFQSQGFGQKILAYMAKHAIENNCGLLEWLVLDENTRARSFYKRMGALAENGWTVHRAKGSALKEIASFYN